MAAALPSNWLERVARSLSDHEERRDSLQNFPPRYEVLDEISRGGMGIVYRAWDPQLGRNVALKVLRSEDGSAAEAHERFQREARLAAGLHHPHIVPVYDTGTWNGQDYIAMQLIDGVTLEQAKPDRRTALACIRDAARALQYAHEQGIVHRDIKPSNLMLDAQGRLFIMDFGIARQAVSTSGMTSPGTVVGTPAYMSPEQAQGLPLDARSDVYSLGATLYELVTGRAPYQGEPLEVVEAVRTKDPDSARRLVGDLSKNVEAILAGAMERRAQDRYPSAAALADDIERYLKGERPHRRQRGLSYKVQREFVRHPWRSAAHIVFWVLVVTTGLAVREAIRNREPRPPETVKILPPSASEKLNREPIEPPKPPPPAPPAPVPLPAFTGPDLDALFDSIETLIRNGSFDEARRQLVDLEESDPDRVAEPRVLLHRAEFDHGVAQLRATSEVTETNDFEGIVDNLLGNSYSDRADRSTQLAPLLFRRGVAFANARKWKESLKSFDSAAELNLQTPELFEKRGLTLLQLESWKRAEEDYIALKRRSSSNATLPAAFATLPYRKAHETLLAKKWTETIDHADDALRLDPKHAPSLHDRGLARFFSTRQAGDVLQHELKPAMTVDNTLIPDAGYREVVLQFSRDQDDRYWKAGDAATRESLCHDALGWLDLFLSRFTPRDPDLLLERGGMRRRLGDMTRALDDATAAYKTRADGDTALFLGQLEYLQGRQADSASPLLQSALQHLSEAQRSSPREYRPLYWRGLCHLAIGGDSLENAVQDLSEARKINAPSPFLALQLSSARLLHMSRKQNSEGSKEAAEEALPVISSPDLLTEEDFVAAGHGTTALDKPKALKALTRDARLNRAKAFLYGSLYTASVQESTAALQSDEGSAAAYYWRGRARYAAHQFRMAREDFKSAIQYTGSPGDRKNLESWITRCELEE